MDEINPKNTNKREIELVWEMRERWGRGGAGSKSHLPFGYHVCD